MNNLKKIRENFGLSQQQVAHWLGVSRSLAEHYERGIRNLPAHALLQLAKLEMMAMEFEEITVDVAVNGSIETNLAGNITREHASDNHREIFEGKISTANDSLAKLYPKLAFDLDKVEKLQQQLTVLKSRHNVLEQQIKLVQKMIENCDEQTCKKEKLWLQMLYHGLCNKITKFDDSKQLKVKAMIMEIRIKHEFLKS